MFKWKNIRQLLSRIAVTFVISWLIGPRNLEKSSLPRILSLWTSSVGKLWNGTESSLLLGTFLKFLILKFCIPPYSKKVGCCSLILRYFTQIFAFDVGYSNKRPLNCGMKNHPPYFSISEHFELNTIDIYCCLPEYICITLSVDHSAVAVTFREMFFSHTF